MAYSKYGAKAVVIARFMPIIRTLAPFVAGIGAMPYRTFAIYNVFGAALWVGSVTAVGYFFGNIPWVRHRIEFVVLGIIVVSLLPLAIEAARSLLQKKSAAPTPPAN